MHHARLSESSEKQLEKGQAAKHEGGLAGFDTLDESFKTTSCYLLVNTSKSGLKQLWFRMAHYHIHRAPTMSYITSIKTKLVLAGQLV
jgi:hypothetical protein